MTITPRLGRPPQRGERKRTLCVRLTPTLLRYLAGQEASAANVIEDCLRATKGFKDWAADKA